MKAKIPPTSEVRDALSLLDNAALKKLAADSGVPFTTLIKIKAGETENPGIETVRKFYRLLSKTRRCAT